MDFFDVLKKRHSIRGFLPKPIDSRVLEKVLESANRAPSAGNLQAFELYCISGENRKKALAEAALDQEFVAQASVILVFCAHAARSLGKYGKRGADLYCLQDATIACSFAMLAAEALGLSSVWVGAFDEEVVRQIIGAPETHRPVAILPLGYAAEVPRDTSRRSLSDLVHHIK